MSVPVFNRVDSTALYVISSLSNVSIPYWAGFLAGDDSNFGQTISLEQAWQAVDGVYLFLKEAPEDVSTFVADLRQYLRQTVRPLRILWFMNPNGGMNYWEINSLAAYVADNGDWYSVQQVNFNLGSYALSIDAEATLTLLNSEASGYGIEIEQSKLNFFSPQGRFPASAQVIIPFVGSALGSFSTQLSLNKTDSQDDLNRLGIMLRYANHNPDNPIHNVNILSMPVFVKNGIALTVQLRYDPLNSLNADRSHLGSIRNQSGGTPELLTNLLTTRGYRITAKPFAVSQPLWEARFSFCQTPLYFPKKGQIPPVDYHLSPDGAFQLGFQVAHSDNQRVMLGISGLEYVLIAPNYQPILFFRVGQPAFVNPQTDQSSTQILNNLGTTAHMTILPSSAGEDGLTYFAQPRQAPLFTDNPDLPNAETLDYLEIPAATLASYSTGGDVPDVFPTGIFHGLRAEDVELARTIEQAALAPARHAIITETASQPAEPTADVQASLENDTEKFAITPQGLVTTLTSDKLRLQGIVLANTPKSQHKEVKLTAVGSELQTALQSNQLFFVVADVNTFMASSSVAYKLTDQNLSSLVLMGVAEDKITALKTYAESTNYRVYPTETDFDDDADLKRIAGDDFSKVRSIAGMLKADVDGWNFQLSPRSWRNDDDDSPTLMIFKFCHRSLEAVVNDIGSWGWQDVAKDTSGNVKGTQTVICNIINTAKNSEKNSPYYHFYETIVADPNWNGILFLNAPVSLAEFPADLQFLTAGLEIDRFYAQYVGFSLTPFAIINGTISLRQTSIFGLINYHDPVDLSFDKTIPYGFKTRTLTAIFENAALTGFSADVELLLNKMFGAELNKQPTEHGNNLILTGSYQLSNQRPGYAFNPVGENTYMSAGSVLQQIDIQTVQLQSKRGLTGTNIATDFILSGNLYFAEVDNFDIYSYGNGGIQNGEQIKGNLRFGNFVITMSFDINDPEQPKFISSIDRINFDLGNSNARPDSLANHFPMTLTAMVSSTTPRKSEESQGNDEEKETQSPEDLGYIAVVSPIVSDVMTDPWFGLVFTLDLGTLGALAGSAGLYIRVLAAWMPADVNNNVGPLYVGIQLPSATSLGLQWSLQGIMSLGFRSIQFETYQENGQIAYMLRLRRLALSLLGMSFPPGNTDVFLFGNPDNNTDTKLGWYAAYASDKKDEQNTGSNAINLAKTSTKETRLSRKLQSGRRRLPPKGGR